MHAWLHVRIAKGLIIAPKDWIVRHSRQKKGKMFELQRDRDRDRAGDRDGDRDADHLRSGGRFSWIFSNYWSTQKEFPSCALSYM